MCFEFGAGSLVLSDEQHTPNAAAVYGSGFASSVNAKQNPINLITMESCILEEVVEYAVDIDFVAHVRFLFSLV